MKFNSTRLGEFEFKEENIIYFPLGIPGFDNLKKYIILTKENMPYFYFLHSVEDENLMFILTNPFLFYSDYSFKLSDEDQYFLKIENENELGENVLIFSIITINEKEKKFSLNLKAPLIINFSKKIGKQVILYDYDYPVKFEINFGQKIQKTAKKVNLNFAQKLI